MDLLSDTLQNHSKPRIVQTPCPIKGTDPILPGGSSTAPKLQTATFSIHASNQCGPRNVQLVHIREPLAPLCLSRQTAVWSRWSNICRQKPTMLWMSTTNYQLFLNSVVVCPTACCPVLALWRFIESSRKLSATHSLNHPFSTGKGLKHDLIPSQYICRFHDVSWFLLSFFNIRI